MRADEPGLPDWRDASAYSLLLGADRSLFAWEWLRRNPDYRAAAHRSKPGAPERARRWGLHALEDPDLPAPFARPVWRSDQHPAVLVAAASASGGNADAFDLCQVAGFATLLRGAGAEHLLLSDGLRAVRIDILGGSLASGPVRLRYLLHGLESAERPMLTLRRFLALCRTGRFSRSLHPADPRARRRILMLRAHDALAAGAGQRDVAAALLGRSAAEPRWRTEAPSLRSQAQRLVRAARVMPEEGYLDLLR